MNDTEQLIKDALGQLAERTPHPGPTLNALRRKRKRQRNNNIFLIATAGMAAVAVLIFAGVIASDRYLPPDHNDGAAALMPTSPNGQGVAIKYAPHWLPDGYVENYRSVGAETTRVWVPASLKESDPTQQTGEPRISLRNLTKLPDVGGWAETSVRGLKAWVRTVQGQSPGVTTDVVWQAQDVLSVSVRGEGNGQDTAMRVAESVRADTKSMRADVKSTYLAPFSFEGRPASDIWGSTLNRWTAQWRSEKFVVTLSTSAPAQTSGTPVTVRGKQGALVGHGSLVVQDSGLWLTVTGESLGTDVLVDAANRVSMQHMDHPDTDWIGKGLL